MILNPTHHGAVRRGPLRAAILVFPVLLASATVLRAGLAPYPVDTATLHLWHLDETSAATNAASAVPFGVTLQAISNGAAPGEAALPGFGFSASTYDGGPAATLSANPNGVPGRDAYLGPLPLVNGSGDNLALACAGTNGAFTFEALVRTDFNPTDLAVAPDTSRHMQILSADGDTSERIMQFRIQWNTTNDTTPELQFVNIAAAGVQNLVAEIPLSGSNAMTQGRWYHVAVTFNGEPDTANNLKLYWTAADTNRVRADLLASLRMTNRLNTGEADWTIGNEGRATGGSDGNWVGLIDEVRISGAARNADDFVFFADTDTDGLPDAWEMVHFSSLAQGPAGDPDIDGFTTLQEYAGGSSPGVYASNPGDRDGDGLPDIWEYANFGLLAQDPTGDPDGDGFSNLQEYQAGTDPSRSSSTPGDADDDGLPDAWELAHFGSLSMGSADDPDADGFTNGQEYADGTRPADDTSYPPRPVTRYIPVDDGDPATSEYGYAGSSGINTICFIQSALLTVGDRQFVAYYGRHQTNSSYSYNNCIWIGRRTLDSGTWEVFRTSFTANNIADGHDTVCFGIDGDGFLHMSWGMHADAFHYARTTNAVTGDEPIVFGPDETMTGKENGVTYPQFFNLPDGDLLYLFREGGSGNGDTYLNRYDTATRSWTNVHRSGSTQLPFIKGTGWTPNYNAYPNMPCVDSNGNVFLVWTWRYNSDSPEGEIGYQTNHDFDYARSTNAGLTWLRSDGTPYSLPITENGENGDTNSMAEKVLSIPEGSSLINQAGMCLDRSGQPVIATWWAPGTVTNDYRRQYMVAFPSTNGWTTRQVSWRTNDPPSTKYSETYVRHLGRPVIVCDRDDRLIVLYRDNAGSNGLSAVYSLPRAADPERRIWTPVDLTTDNLGVYEPVIDPARWERDNVLNILYQPSAGMGYTPPANTAAPIGVLEWDAAAYFAHEPRLRLALTNNSRDAVLSFPSQAGWGYRLWSGTDLDSWDPVDTIDGSGGFSGFLHTNGVSGSPRFWRVEAREGAPATGFP